MQISVCRSFCVRLCLSAPCGWVECALDCRTVAIDDAMETRARSRIGRQLDGHILTSLTAHKGYLQVCAREKREQEQAEEEKSPRCLSKGLSAWSESRLQRVSDQSGVHHNSSSTCSITHTHTHTHTHTG